jgi:hypothetical protein
MIEVARDFWLEAESAQVLVCTINTVTRRDGQLVMGAGIAKDFAGHFPWLPDCWGIRTKGIQNNRTYPFVEMREPWNQDPHIVGIHTKFNWKDRSPFKLVERSVKQLFIIAEALNWHSILMTRPGCGHGGLHWEKQVKPLCETVLEDRFTIVHQDQ